MVWPSGSRTSPHHDGAEHLLNRDGQMPSSRKPRGFVAMDFDHDRYRCPLQAAATTRPPADVRDDVSREIQEVSGLRFASMLEEQ